MKCTVLGEGAWGTAVATVLAHNGHDVLLWCYNKESVDSINENHINIKYMPNVTLSSNIHATDSLEKALERDYIFEAIPVKFLRSVLDQCKPFYQGHQKWIVLSKGIENKSFLLPSQMVQDVFGDMTTIGIVSGPSFAQELIDKKLTAFVVASKNQEFQHELSDSLKNDYVRTILSNDILGVQIGGALKNVITLLLGIADGSEWADNTKAYLFTRGFDEMVQVALKKGAQQQTLYGLSGLGDLYLCSLGSLSRNLMVGRRFGKGETIDEIIKKTGCIPESLNTLQSLHEIIKKENLSLPLIQALYSIIFEKTSKETLLTFNK